MHRSSCQWRECNQEDGFDLLSPWLLKIPRTSQSSYGVQAQVSSHCGHRRIVRGTCPYTGPLEALWCPTTWCYSLRRGRYFRWSSASVTLSHVGGSEFLGLSAFRKFKNCLLEVLAFLDSWLGQSKLSIRCSNTSPALRFLEADIGKNLNGSLNYHFGD